MTDTKTSAGPDPSTRSERTDVTAGMSKNAASTPVPAPNKSEGPKPAEGPKPGDGQKAGDAAKAPENKGAGGGKAGDDPLSKGQGPRDKPPSDKELADFYRKNVAPDNWKLDDKQFQEKYGASKDQVNNAFKEPVNRDNANKADAERQGAIGPGRSGDKSLEQHNKDTYGSWKSANDAMRNSALAGIGGGLAAARGGDLKDIAAAAKAGAAAGDVAGAAAGSKRGSNNPSPNKPPPGPTPPPWKDKDKDAQKEKDKDKGSDAKP